MTGRKNTTAGATKEQENKKGVNTMNENKNTTTTTEQAQTTERATYGFQFADGKAQFLIPAFVVKPYLNEEKLAIDYTYTTDTEQDKTTKLYNINKGIENPAEFSRLIQSFIFDKVQADMDKLTADIMDKYKDNPEEITAQDKATKDGAQALKERIEKLRKVYKTPKTHGAITDNLAMLCACYIGNYNLNIDGIAEFCKTYEKASATIDGAIERLLDTKSATLSKEEQETLTNFKTALKGALDKFTRASDNGIGRKTDFNLKISNKDIITFYKLATQGATLDKAGKITFKYLYTLKDGKPAKAFYRTLATFLLDAMGILQA